MTERETEIRDMNTGQRFRTAVRRVAACSLIAATCSIPFSGNVHAQSAQVGQSQDANQAGQGLPGGASSLQETYGDWRVACAQQNGKKICALSQRQTDKDSRQLVLAVELSAPAADKAEGTLILPFGLRSSGRSPCKSTKRQPVRLCTSEPAFPSAAWSA